jgi:hypothetical protein
MRRLSLIIILFFLSVNGAWGASTLCYVAPTGSSGNNGLTVDTPKALPSQCVTVLNAIDPDGDPTPAIGQGHKIYILTGTYSDTILINDVDMYGSSIIGVTNLTTLTESARGQIILNGSGSHSIRVQIANVTMRNIQASGNTGASDFLWRIEGDNFTGSKLVGKTGKSYVFYCANPGLNITDSEMGGTTMTADFAIKLASACAGTVSYNKFIGDGTSTVGGGGSVDLNTSGIMNFYNNYVGGSLKGTLAQTGAGTGNVTNNTIMPSAKYNYYPVLQSAGTLNLITNNIVPGWDRSHYTTTGTLNTNTGNITTNGGTGVVRRQKGGYIIPVIDDSDALSSDYLNTLETSLSSRGMKGTIAYQANTAVANSAALTALKNRGIISIAGHGFSGSNLTLTGNAWSITKAGHTVNINRAGDQILIEGAAPVTVTGFKAKSLYTIMTELAAGGCTNGGLTTNLYSATLGESLADSAGAQASGYVVQLKTDDTTGATGYYKVELKDTKTLIEAAIGSTTPLFVTPGANSSSNLQTVAKAVGYLALRGTQEDDATNSNWLGASYNIFKGAGLAATRLIGANDAGTIANAKALAEMVAESGSIIYVFAHNYSGSPDFTNAQWELVLSAWVQYSDITVTSADTVINAIVSGGLWATADDITYTRTYTDQSDYRLRAGSSAINAGADLCGTLVTATDMAGRAVCTTSTYVGKGTYPEIGAYEFWPSGGGIFGGSGGWNFRF